MVAVGGAAKLNRNAEHAGVWSRCDGFGRASDSDFCLLMWWLSVMGGFCLVWSGNHTVGVGSGGSSLYMLSYCATLNVWCKL